jgi:hypothetical protein
MSVDYYMRLEQGRERSPSSQVLDALSEALQLGDDARLHLYQLAGLAPGQALMTSPERVDPELLGLMDTWPDTPAIVLGRAYDVLAGNALAYALFEDFKQGPNLLVKVFLDANRRSFYPDWEEVARNTVAGFRLLHGRTPQNPRIRNVLADVSHRSAEFAELWNRHEARGKRVEIKRFRHPDVGELTLRLNAFDIRSVPGQELIVYHAEPGSRSAHALALLGTLAATRAENPPQDRADHAGVHGNRALGDSAR